MDTDFELTQACKTGINWGMGGGRHGHIVTETIVPYIRCYRKLLGLRTKRLSTSREREGDFYMV